MAILNPDIPDLPHDVWMSARSADIRDQCISEVRDWYRDWIEKNLIAELTALRLIDSAIEMIPGAVMVRTKLAPLSEGKAQIAALRAARDVS